MNITTSPNPEQIIITAQPAAAEYALAELQALDSAAKRAAWLQEDAQLVNIPGGYRKLLDNIRSNPPVFIRHLFPVNLAIPSENFNSGCLAALSGQLCPGDKFSIQMRHCATANNIPETKAAVWQYGDMLQAAGQVYDAKQPDKIISVYFSNETVYAGLSRSGDNLSDWNGGIHRFRREENLISRAEFKLLEAINSFGITFPDNCKTALDLGAAPGGWTRVLLQNGMKVTAVDPAEMHETLRADDRVKHFRGTSQNFHCKPGSYQLLVNDMRMDCLKSAAIMLDMRDCLSADGSAVMTLKLPGKNWPEIIRQTFNILEHGYEIRRARQLFSNRSEITVYMKKKNL